MAFMKGVKHWQLRSKHGRDLLFSSPDLLWTAACEYFEWADSNPWRTDKWVGKDAKHVSARVQRPYNYAALTLYLCCSATYFSDFKKRCKEDASLNYFSEVVEAIDRVMFSQKFEGASVGAFNPSIIMRDLGMVEKTETKIVGGGESGQVEVTLNL